VWCEALDTRESWEFRPLQLQHSAARRGSGSGDARRVFPLPDVHEWRRKLHPGWPNRGRSGWEEGHYGRYHSEDRARCDVPHSDQDGAAGRGEPRHVGYVLGDEYQRTKVVVGRGSSVVGHWSESLVAVIASRRLSSVESFAIWSRPLAAGRNRT